jgi:hypothetical protein
MLHFPHEVAYLPRTKLSYVNLPGILGDGKRDRTARVPGFVVVQLGERCYLIFLRDGEPFQAARIEPNARAQVALAEVVRIAGTESERGESGQIAYYGAPEAQLRAMLSTLVQPPVPCGEGVDPRRPDLLFPYLRGCRFSGVVEIRAGGSLQYLVFREGGFHGGYFSENRGVPASEALRAVFGSCGGDLCVTLYPGLDELPVQASPGLVDLYRRIIGGTMRDLGNVVGEGPSMVLMRRAQEAAAAREPVVGAFVLTEEGRVRGDPVATPPGLTDAAAAWVTEALIDAAEGAGVDPTEVLARVARDSRFVLEEQGFFARLPWTVAF